MSDSDQGIQTRQRLRGCGSTTLVSCEGSGSREAGTGSSTEPLQSAVQQRLQVILAFLEEGKVENAKIAVSRMTDLFTFKSHATGELVGCKYSGDYVLDAAPRIKLFSHGSLLTTN